MQQLTLTIIYSPSSWKILNCNGSVLRSGRGRLSTNDWHRICKALRCEHNDLIVSMKNWVEYFYSSTTLV